MIDFIKILKARRCGRAAKRATRLEARMMRRIARVEARKFRREMRSCSPCPKILLGYAYCNKSRYLDCDHSAEALRLAISARDVAVDKRTARNIA